ncbi:c-type cytochrome [Methyloceanibacter sp. wino2]|uniref:c-type cytochrome n=1 Tax=Methyloceanibacter sp. wino2 TaxID=2170729 RepID=UPI00131F0028|nr:c-type cytochrome [Methyloceanibacter sp. wino2]
MRTVAWELCIALAAVAGVGAGYLLTEGGTTVRYPSNVPQKIDALDPGPKTDLIRYGRDLVEDTPRFIGKSAQNPAMAFGGNNLSCQSCHLNAGLKPFAAPFVSTAATFPMLVDNKVITLPDRINSCMRLGLNGKPLPEDSREMLALIAYLEFVGKDTPEGVRLPGSGLMPIAVPRDVPSARRGETVYAQHCLSCHGQDGQGAPRLPPEVGYYVPPLWGEDSFNGGAGMGQIAYAASYIRANMPIGVDHENPVLSVQDAWDVAAYMIVHPRPMAPARQPVAPMIIEELPIPAPADANAALPGQELVPDLTAPPPPPRAP